MRREGEGAGGSSRSEGLMAQRDPLGARNYR